MPTAEAIQAENATVHVLWINAGLSCDGDSVALTAATQPSIEEIALGALPGLPNVAVHWPLIDFECGPTGGRSTPSPSSARGRSRTRRCTTRATGAGSATTR